MKSELWKMLKHCPSAWSASGLLLMQQLIVCSSTLWIARLSHHIAESKPFVLDLLLFLTSLFVVFIPGTLSIYFSEKAKFDFLSQYIQGFEKNFFGRSLSHADPKLRDKTSSFLSSESFLVIEEAANLIYNWLSTGLNVALNVLVVSLVVDQKFILGYLVSFILVFLLLKKTGRRVELPAEKAQAQRVSLQENLKKAWDNVVLGNRYNFEQWRSAKNKSFVSAKAAAAHSMSWTQWISSAAMTLSMLPVLTILVWSFIQNIGNWAMLAVLVATLPRQIQIIQFMHGLVSYFVQWKATKNRLSGLSKGLEILDGEESYLERIHWDKLKLSGKDTEKIPLRDWLSYSSGWLHGRFTLRGENGAGKSTFLRMLKENYGDEAIYLPSHSQLSFEDEKVDQGSTGQQIKRKLNELLHIRKMSVLLLDEWDANLDERNRNEIDQRIEEVAKDRIVIEARHQRC